MRIKRKERQNQTGGKTNGKIIGVSYKVKPEATVPNVIQSPEK